MLYQEKELQDLKLMINDYPVGIFGGSFDPPHKAHLKISLNCIKQLKLIKIYWIVTKKNPFKKKPLFSVKERIEKSKILSKEHKKIKVIFLDNKIQSSRTIDILNFLKKKEAKNKFFLIIGADSLLNFNKWKSWKKITNLCQLVVFPRKGHDQKAKKSAIVKFLNKENIIFIKNKKLDISSTLIRKKIKNK